MIQRGVLYLVWGDDARVKTVLKRSRDSLANIHPELPVHVEQLPPGSGLLDKARMFDLSPFEETLFLDADTVVLDTLEFGFEKARQTGLACSICECPWARRYGDSRLSGDMVEYNTGVLFFTRAARAVFDAWMNITVHGIDSSILLLRQGQLCRMTEADQAPFALAVEETGSCPFVLPYNWNFRPQWHHSWFGPIKIWHDYSPVPESVIAFTRRQARSDAVIAFAAMHAARKT